MSVSAFALPWQDKKAAAKPDETTWNCQRKIRKQGAAGSQTNTVRDYCTHPVQSTSTIHSYIHHWVQAESRTNEWIVDNSHGMVSHATTNHQKGIAVTHAVRKWHINEEMHRAHQSTPLHAQAIGRPNIIQIYKYMRAVTPCIDYD